MRPLCLNDRLIQQKKSECTGCHACFNACPVHAISMKRDMEGFLYPSVDENICIHCGRCVQVCQIFQKQKDPEQIPSRAFACMNTCMDERLSSSSGGIFILLARYVIERNGYVFGAAFDEHMHLSHTYASTLEGCRAFMGSKYLQSRIGTSFSDAKRFLNQGKWVLFTGTPCQIHGLKLFLGREYEKLIAVDLACHGVPSPAVFERYIDDLGKKYGSQVVGFSFRSKKTGWKSFSSQVEFEDKQSNCTEHDQCPYMKAFLSNLDLRPYCYRCNNKEGNHFSDLTMGDFWGAKAKEADMDDDKGTSVLLTNTAKGGQILQGITQSLFIRQTDLKHVLEHNGAMVRAVSMNPYREKFFYDFNHKDAPLEELILPYLPKRSVKEKIKAMVPAPIKEALKKALKPWMGG